MIGVFTEVGKLLFARKHRRPGIIALIASAFLACLFFLLPQTIPAQPQSSVSEDNCPDGIYSEVTPEPLHQFACGSMNVSALPVEEIPPELRSDLSNTLSEGGMFEIVAANHSAWNDLCPMLVLRMPWSDESNEGFEDALSKKKSLFYQLTSNPKNVASSVSVMAPLSNPMHPRYSEKLASTVLTPDGGECVLFFLTDATSGAYLE